MESIQMTGPFKKGEEYLFDVAGAQFLQVGIEIGDQIPMAVDERLTPNFKVNGDEFRISDAFVLEWDGFAETEVSIIPLQDFDARTMVNVAYE